MVRFRSAPVLALTAATALAPVIWGTTYAVTTELLPPGRPLLASVLRALPVGLALVALAGVLPRGIWWLRALVLGTLNMGLFFALLFVAAYRLPGGAAATLTALQPLVALGLGAWWLAAKPSRTQVGAAAAGAAGVGLVVGGSAEGLDAAGVAAALGAAVSMAAGVVLTKRWQPDVSPLAVASWQLVAGGAVLLPVALLVEGPPPALGAAEVVGFAYLGVFGTGLAYWLWIRGLGRLPVAAVSVLALLSPVSATVIDWVGFGRPLGSFQLVGAGLVLGGVLASQLAAHRTPRSAGLRVPPTAAAAA